MICSLCLQEKDLQGSHILPEFLYKNVYNPDHSFFSLSTAPDEPTKKYRKGLYEKLLCYACEQIIGEYENYAAKVLNGGTRISIQQFPEKILIGNLDYTQFKLFQISLLWRAGVSSNREFQNIELGPHAEVMRKMIFTKTPGEPHKYGCLLFYSSTTHQMMKRMINPFEKMKKNIGGFHFYRAVLGGLMWAQIVSNRSHQFRYQPGFLQKNGELPIFNSGPLGDMFMRDFATAFKNSGKIDEVLRRTMQ
jgi:hypothetical protein